MKIINVLMLTTRRIFSMTALPGKDFPIRSKLEKEESILIAVANQESVAAGSISSMNSESELKVGTNYSARDEIGFYAVRSV